MSLLSNLKKRGLKDVLSSRIFSYIESKLQLFSGVYLKKDDVISYAEQVIYKRVMCNDCYIAGECLHCGCDFNDLTVSTIASCSKNKWGKIMNKNDWENYKKKYMNGVDFGLVTKNKI